MWISQKCLKFEDIENKSGKSREKIGKEKEKDYLCIIIYRSSLLGFVFPELAIERGDVDMETRSVEMSVFSSSINGADK